MQCEEHTAPASANSMAEICILALPCTATHRETPDGWAAGYSVCLQRDPQLGSPAGRHTGYGRAHSTFQLKQKGVVTSQSVMRSRRCILSVACEDKSLGNIISGSFWACNLEQVTLHSSSTFYSKSGENQVKIIGCFVRTK